MSSYGDASSTTVSVCVECCENYKKDLYDVSSVIGEEHGVLVVDPLEDEPYFRFACRTVAALSNLGAYEQLKFNSKVSGVVYMVVGPWAPSECTAAAWVESRLGREDLGYTLSEVTETVRERWEHVGGLPRFVLGSEIEYKERVRLQDAVIDMDWRIGWFVNVKPAANFFIAAEASTCYARAWQFLCPSRAAAYLRLAESQGCNERLYTLLQYGLDVQVLEQFLCEGLLSAHKQGVIWGWYPFRKGSRDPSTKLASPPLGLKPLSASELFEGQFLW